MTRISRNLTALYRTETLIARRRLSVMRRQAILFAAAGLAGLAALVLLNMALYFALAQRLGPAPAAALLALANLGLAGGLALIATRASAEPEIAPALELRDLALDELHADIDELGADMRAISDHLKAARADPLGSLVAMLLPLLTDALKKKPD